MMLDTSTTRIGARSGTGAPDGTHDAAVPRVEQAANLDLAKLRNIRFHQLVTLVETLYGDRPRVGDRSDPANEAIRFRATRSLSFGPADMSEVTFDPDTEQFEVRVNFFGLYGPASPLPPYYTERIIEDDQTPSAVEDLLDLFNHRAVSLLHVIWRKYRYYLRYETGGSDPLSKRVLALCGFPIEDRDRIADIARSALLPHVALLSLYSSSAEVVASTLSNFFRAPFRVEEFISRTVIADEHARLQLGVANTVLGEDAVLGWEIEDDLGKFRICLGHAAFEALTPFLPGGHRHRELVELLTMITREPLEWDIQFEFDAKTVPVARLGESQLGWATWLSAPDPNAMESTVRIAAIEGVGEGEGADGFGFADLAGALDTGAGFASSFMAAAMQGAMT